MPPSKKKQGSLFNITVVTYIKLYYSVHLKNIFGFCIYVERINMMSAHHLFYLSDPSSRYHCMPILQYFHSKLHDIFDKNEKEMLNAYWLLVSLWQYSK